jgi:hypothetical protein
MAQVDYKASAKANAFRIITNRKFRLHGCNDDFFLALARIGKKQLLIIKKNIPDSFSSLSRTRKV